ncbi:RING finger membrane protein [Blastomyces dermatitidis ATCC 18188]|uniref:RING-type E3 ubiquitin transferase n=1 Tax=Ajellomyces dermatitidis (strain ATCC 18188 / CBS 674.68) TaxID=653446 RepID=F2TFB9_AJEDA|nr:RING finger membrane protein [Blastomyces dermatitidis ATCC 18188]
MDINRIVAGRDRRAGPLPDIMNDPAFATNTATNRRSVDESDTCRICRGEGTEEEQLFYPCKCSGSIKFVHQECLMQWLSHSQKKYCELCKTPFRFTKLYDPNMPKELPAPVFLKELILHGGRSLLTWLRFVLVAFVWLGWLPWSMRAIWRGLFWLADGRWPNPEFYHGSSVPPASQALDQLAAHGTSPANTLASNNLSTGVGPQNMTPTLPSFVSPFSAMLNFSAGEPLIYTIMKKLLRDTWATTTSSVLETAGSNSTNATSVSIRRFRQPSWLSDVSFLNKLTPYSTLNNILIDTFEGQIITLSVVIAFILVFLIREWVVQQQPAINLAEADREAAAQLIADAAANQPVEEPRPRPVQHVHHQEAHEEPSQEDNQEPNQEILQEENREDVSEHENSGLPDWDHTQSNDMSLQPDQPQQPGGPSHDLESLSQHWPSQVENNSNQGTIDEVGHILEHAPTTNQANDEIVANSENHGNAQWPGLDVFKDLWTRGARNPTEILRIIEEEGRQEELGWVIAAMQKLERVGEQGFKFGEISEGTLQENDEGSASALHAPFDAPMHHDDGPHPSSSASIYPPREERREIQDTPERTINLRFGDPTANPSVPTDSSSPVFPNLEPFTPSARFGSEVAGPSGSRHSVDLSSHTLRHNSSDHSSPPQEAVQLPDSQASLYPPTPAEQHAPEVNIHEQGSMPATEAEPSEAPLQRPHPMEAVGPRPESLVDRASNWFWGGVPLPRRGEGEGREEDRDAEPAIENPAQEAPFEPAPNGHHHFHDPMDEPGFADGPIAPVDPDDIEPVDDADDLEGLLELIGMQGPIVGLLQNGVFSALIVSFTVAVGIWLPYLWGKIALVLFTNPIRLLIGVPIALVSLVVDITVDTLLGSVGYIVYLTNVLFRFLLVTFGRFIPSLTKFSGSNALTAASLSMIDQSSQRLKGVLGAFFTFHESDLPMFSVLSHQALRIHQERIATFFSFILSLGKTIVYDTPLLLLQQGASQRLIASILSLEPMNLLNTAAGAVAGVGKSALFFLETENWPNLKIGGVEEKVSLSLNHDLAQWDTKDRIIAIIVGYCFASVLGMLYLRFSALFSGPRQENRREGAVADVLQQAGGVMKVILIIGIEMIVFPLYCGILLDIALLPLFRGATLSSRTAFTLDSPFTSLFVHWFIGTCYMFHFALFVSMCRKIMRSGVLYFIRDPDDPTFHPVRDVLERNITTQLRKIAFSALVYGGLVIVCLGGVVWGLSLSFRDVLPVHWSSNEPVLEFPVDLLFYNFVMPLAIRYIRPSDGLHKMYNWWFHKCAHKLRLTHFLFGKRRKDEEGRHAYPTWRGRIFGRRDTLEGENRRKIFLRDGRFVRAPGSDQVRIPKGTPVFLEVDENNKRIDGKEDSKEGLHGRSNKMFAHVYVPPRFKTRIAIFIFMIWVFAAVTGLGCTIVPLVIGRWMISSLFPSHIRVNDIYAFSTGIYVVGGVFYALVYCRHGLPALRQCLQPYLASPRQAFPHAYNLLVKLISLLYIGWAYALFLPSLFALLTELYVLIPLHTYIGGGDAHVIHFVQDWTLGVLYVRMAVRFILWYRGSRPANALNSILRNGWMNSDIKLATRAFIVPATLLGCVAILVPLPVGAILNSTIFRDSSATVRSEVYRYCFPATLMAVLLVWAAHQARKKIAIWRVGVRDDVYLIGERLHNFGEKRAKDVGVTRRMITS